MYKLDWSMSLSTEDGTLSIYCNDELMVTLPEEFSEKMYYILVNYFNIKNNNIQ